MLSTFGPPAISRLDQRVLSTHTIRKKGDRGEEGGCCIVCSFPIILILNINLCMNIYITLSDNDSSWNSIWVVIISILFYSSLPYSTLFYCSLLNTTVIFDTLLNSSLLNYAALNTALTGLYSTLLSDAFRWSSYVSWRVETQWLPYLGL